MSSKPAETIAPRALWTIARTLICNFFSLFGEPQHIARQGFITVHARALLLTWLRAGEAVLRHLLLIEAAALMPSLPRLRGDTHPRPNASQSNSATSGGCVSPREPRNDPNTPETWRVSFRCFIGDTHARRSLRKGRSTDSLTCVPPMKRPRTRADPYENYFKDPEQTVKLRAAKSAWLAEMNALCASPPARGGSPEQSEGKGEVGIAHRAPSDRCAITSPACGGELYSLWPLAERAEALLRAFNAPAPHARRLAFRLRRAPHQARHMLRIPADMDRAVNRETVAQLHREAARHRPPHDSS